MLQITRREILRVLTLGLPGLAGCDSRQLADSRRLAWGVLLDLSGTAA